jgi:hypothetical protein
MSRRLIVWREWSRVGGWGVVVVVGWYETGDVQMYLRIGLWVLSV